MTGQRIESQPSFPFGAALWVVLALVLAVMALLTWNPHPAIASALPWCVAGMFLWSRERPFAAVLTEAGVEVEYPSQTIPYSDFQGLRAPGRPANPYKAAPRAFPLVLIHAGGLLRIPKRLNVSSDELFLFLLKQFPTENARPIDPRLEAYRSRKQAEFGAERIWCYVARAVLGTGQDTRVARGEFEGLALAGAFWVFCAIARREVVWGVLGGLGIVLGGLCTLVSFLETVSRTPPIRLRNWRGASIVICPDGLDLVQGNLSGQLQWRELRDVRLKRTREGDFLVLEVAGVQFPVPDVYNRPLVLLYQHIHYYWRGEGATLAKPAWAKSEEVAAVVSPLRPSSTGITPGFLAGRAFFPEQ
jgi:hypothetical protein